MHNMNTKELAKKFMDDVLYGCGIIDRLNPFNEEKHYGEWTEKIEAELNKIVPKFGEDFFDDEFIEMFADGDYDDMMKNTEKYSCLKPLNDMLNDYFDWLNENID